MPLVALFLLQAASVRAPAAPPQRFSILADCPAPHGDEVVVCATPDRPRLPLPAERGPPDGPRRPTGDPRAALDADGGACALRGCQVGVDVMGMGVAAIRLAGELIAPDSCCDRAGEGSSAALLLHDVAAGLRGAFATKPAKRGRVPIDLDAPPASTAGRLSP